MTVLVIDQPSSEVLGSMPAPSRSRISFPSCTTAAPRAAMPIGSSDPTNASSTIVVSALVSTPVAGLVPSPAGQGAGFVAAGTYGFAVGSGVASRTQPRCGCSDEVRGNRPRNFEVTLRFASSTSVDTTARIGLCGVTSAATSWSVGRSRPETYFALHTVCATTPAALDGMWNQSSTPTAATMSTPSSAATAMAIRFTQRTRSPPGPSRRRWSPDMTARRCPGRCARYRAGGARHRAFSADADTRVDPCAGSDRLRHHEQRRGTADTGALPTSPAAGRAARGAAVPPAVLRPGALDPRRPRDDGRPPVRRARRRWQRRRRRDRVGRAVPALRGARPARRRLGRPARPQEDPHRLGRHPLRVPAHRRHPARDGVGARRAPGGARRPLRRRRRVLRARVHGAAARHRLADQPAARERAARSELLHRLDRRSGAGRLPRRRRRTGRSVPVRRRDLRRLDRVPRPAASAAGGRRPARRGSRGVDHALPHQPEGRVGRRSAAGPGSPRSSAAWRRTTSSCCRRSSSSGRCSPRRR